MKKLLVFVLCGLIVINILNILYTKEYNDTAYANLEQTEIIPLQTKDEIKVAFIGDQGLGKNAEAVLSLIKQENTSLIVHQGDFDYIDNPTAWDTQTSKILGPTFPQIAVLGNHDIAKANEYKAKISERINKNPDLFCIGKLGETSSCLYKNLLIVSTSPGLGSDNAPAFIDEAFSTTTNVWKICSWHFTQRALQVGDKKDEAGWEPYEACQKAGAMIVTGHEHSYERTYLLDDIKTQHIVSTSSILILSPGNTFVAVSGMGGHSIRPQKLKAPYWASIYSSSQNANHGALFCTFNFKDDTNKAHCYFKDIDGYVADSFDIVR
jgi:hypothetical protein